MSKTGELAANLPSAMCAIGGAGAKHRRELLVSEPARGIPFEGAVPGMIVDAGFREIN